MDDNDNREIKAKSAEQRTAADYHPNFCFFLLKNLFLTGCATT